ncbi:hypothetical protein SAMN06264348_102513 [Oceanospirillum linum]|nr:hypothetical protein SAMN04489856_10327 [Oleiphilus messinensis]SMP13688.1 hypothetical protein SAMN06264348_102513 [Oceanospirillum linum]
MVEVPELPKQKFLLSQAAGIPVITLCKITECGKRFSDASIMDAPFLDTRPVSALSSGPRRRNLLI